MLENRPSYLEFQKRAKRTAALTQFGMLCLALLAACSDATRPATSVTKPPAPPPVHVAADTTPPTGYLQHLLDASGLHGSVVALDSAGDAFGNLSGATSRAVEWKAPNYVAVVLTPLASGRYTRVISVSLDGTAVGQAVDATGNGYTVMWDLRTHAPTILGEALGVTAVCPCDPTTWVYQQSIHANGQSTAVDPPAGFESFTFVAAANGGSFVAAVDAESPSGLGPTTYPYRYSMTGGWAQLDAPDATVITSESPNGTVSGRRYDGTGYIWPTSSLEPMPAWTNDTFPIVFPNAVTDSGDFAGVAFNQSPDSSNVVFINRTKALLELPNATDGNLAAMNAARIVGGVTVDSEPAVWTPTH